MLVFLTPFTSLFFPSFLSFPFLFPSHLFYYSMCISFVFFFVIFCFALLIHIGITLWFVITNTSFASCLHWHLTPMFAYYHLTHILSSCLHCAFLASHPYLHLHCCTTNICIIAPTCIMHGCVQLLHVDLVTSYSNNQQHFITINLCCCCLLINIVPTTNKYFIPLLFTCL